MFYTTKGTYVIFLLSLFGFVQKTSFIIHNFPQKKMCIFLKIPLKLPRFLYFLPKIPYNTQIVKELLSTYEKNKT